MKTILKLTLLMMIMATVAPVLNSCTKNDGNEEPLIVEGNVRHVILWTFEPE